MNKKYIKFIIIGAVLILGIFVYLFITLNPARKESVQTTLRNLFPFGEPQNTITGTTPDGETITINPDTGEVIEQSVPKVRKITEFPVAGYRPLVTETNEQVTRTVTQDDGTEVEKTETVRRNVYSVRYARSDDSFIFDTAINGGLTTNQLTDSLIPNSEQAIFSSDAQKVSLRSYDESSESIQTYLASIEKIPIVAEACPFNFPTNLQFQDTGDAVANIQRFLNGFLGIIISETGENSPGNESGIYDELTRQAVIRFQQQRSLAVDGNVGQTTRTAFQTACNEVQMQKAEALFKINNPYLYRLDGIVAPSNILEFSEPTQQQSVYSRLANGITYFYRYNFTSGATTQIYDSTFSEWLLQPITNDITLITTKASQTVPGYVYEINTAQKTFKKILGDMNGLTTNISPDGKNILYSSSTNTGFTLNLYNRDTGSQRRLGVTTLPEKCAWNTTNTMVYCAVPDVIVDGTYPDNWYQGLIRFTDSLWSINPSTGATNRITSFSNYSETGIDAIDLKVTTSDRYLFFRNKSDKTLWVVDLFQ